MTDDTSQPPAPQPGWVATVTLTIVTVRANAHIYVTLPNGSGAFIPKSDLASFSFAPPPPPPWEPEIGKPAWHHGMTYVVRGLHNDFAWCEDVDGDMYSIPVSDLSPPKGGA